MGTGISRHLSRMLRLDAAHKGTRSSKRSTTLLAKVRSQPQMDFFGVQLKTGTEREGEPTRGALERLLLEVDCAPMTLQGGVS